MVKDRRKLRTAELALAVGLLVACCWGASALHSRQALADKVVRLHVLANSDSDADQALKLQVRDVVVRRAAELLAGAQNRAEAENRLRGELPELQALAAREIAAEGYSYSVTAKLENTSFPTREYDGFTLPAGEYLALRVVIGAGEGHNWWCVVFPPLCTAATSELGQTAMAAGLSEDDVRLITGDGEGYVLRFKTIELLEQLRARLAK